MSTIQIQFSADEAITVLRLLATARRKAASIDERDDLEFLHGRIYDRMYRTQKQDRALATGDSLRIRRAQIHRLLPVDRMQARRAPVALPSEGEWHPTMDAAA
jgi:hypothetical protein